MKHAHDSRNSTNRCEEWERQTETERQRYSERDAMSAREMGGEGIYFGFAALVLAAMMASTFDKYSSSSSLIL